jgi:ankyrin repeat protein
MMVDGSVLGALFSLWPDPHFPPQQVPLHHAADFGDDKEAAVVKALLKYAPEAAFVADKKNGWLPLHWAASKQGGEKGVGIARRGFNTGFSL